MKTKTALLVAVAALTAVAVSGQQQQPPAQGQPPPGTPPGVETREQPPPGSERRQEQPQEQEQPPPTGREAPPGAQTMTEVDQKLVTEIRQVIQTETTLQHVLPQVNIVAQRGVVFLTGNVQCPAEGRLIETLIQQRLPTVTRVQNQIRVAQAGGRAEVEPMTPVDRRLVSEIRQAIQTETTLRQALPQVNIAAQRGVVFLTGTVECPAEKRLIETVIQQQVRGITRVENQIQVTHEMTTGEQPERPGAPTGRDLPPGLEKREELPPGLQREPLPPGLERRPPPGQAPPQQQQPQQQTPQATPPA